MASEPKLQEPKRYANYVDVQFSADEFVLDFGQIFEGAPVMHTGIVATPRSFRHFLRSMASSERRHRAKHANRSGGEE